MSERTRHTKPIPFPITKLTCSKQHEKVVSTTAKAVTLKQKREKSWQLKTSHNTTQNNTIMAEKRKPRFRIFRKIRTLNESETPIREKTIKQTPPWIPKETKTKLWIGGKSLPCSARGILEGGELGEESRWRQGPWCSPKVQSFGYLFHNKNEEIKQKKRVSLRVEWTFTRVLYCYAEMKKREKVCES